MEFLSLLNSNSSVNQNLNNLKPHKIFNYNDNSKIILAKIISFKVYEIFGRPQKKKKLRPEIFFPSSRNLVVKTGHLFIYFPNIYTQIRKKKKKKKNKEKKGIPRADLGLPKFPAS